MRETGVVSKVKGKFATVRFDRKTACEHCNMCLKPREANYVELRLPNTLNAAVGDKVTVAMGNRAVLTAATLVYVLPLIPMAIILACTYKLNAYVSLGASAAGLVAGFVAVALIDRFVIRKRKGYMPVMEAILPKESDSAAPVLAVGGAEKERGEAVSEESDGEIRDTVFGNTDTDTYALREADASSGNATDAD